MHTRGLLLDPTTGRPDTEGPLRARADDDPRFLSVLSHLSRGRELRALLGLNEPVAADGIYYRDTRPPFYITDMTAITGTTEALMWPAQYSSLPANYFTAGKMVKFTAYGRMTTPASAQGNITVTVRFGTTTAGTSLAATAATALVASGTNIPWRCEFYVVCRAQGSGSAGSLMVQGKFETTTAIIASPSTIFFPASAPAAVGVDTTIASGIVVGVTLGSASDTLQTHVLDPEVCN